MDENSASALPSGSISPASAGGEPQNIFYNFLPKQRATGPLVSSSDASGAADGGAGPTQVSAEPNFELSDADASMAAARSALPRRAIIAGIAVIVLIVLGVVGYMLYRGRTQTEPVNEPAAPAETPPVEEAPPPTTQIEGVTTPSDWQLRFFNNETCQNVAACGDAADPDQDGLTNIEEYTYGTDPNNPDSDGDGLADGDEVHVFGGSPLNQRTAGNPDYDDADNAAGGYDPSNNTKYSDERLAQVKLKVKQSGLRQPTIGTLGENNLIRYDFVEGGGAPGGTSINLPSSFDRSPQAVLDRDTQRLTTIRKVGAALIKYKKERPTFPKSPDFLSMVNEIRPYLTVATNPVDPVNLSPLVYGYLVSQTALDFTITYYSESQNQLIKFTAPDAEKSASRETANLNDDQRVRDLESIKSALLIYSEAHRPVNATINYVFPPVENYKTELSPAYLSSIPTDPITGKDYVYTVSDQFDSFALKTILENPPPGQTGYQCTQELCQNY